MDLNELRVGNWVYPGNHAWPGMSINLVQWGPITSIKGDIIHFDDWSCHISLIEGISITQTWLDILDFKHSVSDTNSNFVIYLDKNPVAHVKRQENGVWVSSHVLFVHELQNLYFDYSGHQLKVRSMPKHTREQVAYHTDLMIRSFAAGRPMINEAKFNVEMDGVEYEVYYVKDVNVDDPQWTMADYKAISDNG